MKLKPKISIAEHFEPLEDPRIDRSKDHLLIDILTIALLAVICGAGQSKSVGAGPTEGRG